MYSIRGLVAALALTLAFAGCATAPKESDRQPASSEQLGRPVTLSQCGGHIELRQADNGDLAIKLENVNTQRCPNFRVSDNTSGREIKSYELERSFNTKASYTLSKKMLSSLGTDCRVDFKISGSWNADGFFVYLTNCYDPGSGKKSNSDLSYELSNSRNCKLMKNGQYTEVNVGDEFCSGAMKGDRIEYEWSNSGNCKRMKNDQYTNENVGDRFCDNRHGK